jgi:hypothetical protein
VTTQPPEERDRSESAEPSAAPHNDLTASVSKNDHGVLTLTHLGTELRASIDVVRMRPPMFGAIVTQFDAQRVRRAAVVGCERRMQMTLRVYVYDVVDLIAIRSLAKLVPANGYLTRCRSHVRSRSDVCTRVVKEFVRWSCETLRISCRRHPATN